MQEAIAILVSRASASCDRGALADAEADARWALERAEGVHRVHAVSEMIRVLTERDVLDRQRTSWSGRAIRVLRARMRWFVF